jgi:hypothetical protein
MNSSLMRSLDGLEFLSDSPYVATDCVGGLLLAKACDDRSWQLSDKITHDGGIVFYLVL